jgi:hypothetical protein
MLGGELASVSGGSNITNQVIRRTSLGADSGESLHIIERMNGEAISVTHQVTRGGKIIHQHQTHIGKYGTSRQFPNQWITYQDMP